MPAIAGPSRQSSTCSTIASGGPRLLGIHTRSISQVCMCIIFLLWDVVEVSHRALNLPQKVKKKNREINYDVFYKKKFAKKVQFNETKTSVLCIKISANMKSLRCWS